MTKRKTDNSRLSTRRKECERVQRIEGGKYLTQIPFTSRTIPNCFMLKYWRSIFSIQ